MWLRLASCAAFYSRELYGGVACRLSFWGLDGGFLDGGNKLFADLDRGAFPGTLQAQNPNFAETDRTDK